MRPVSIAQRRMFLRRRCLQAWLLPLDLCVTCLPWLRPVSSWWSLKSSWWLCVLALRRGHVRHVVVVLSEVLGRGCDRTLSVILPVLMLMRRTLWSESVGAQQLEMLLLHLGLPFAPGQCFLRHLQLVLEVGIVGE